LSKSSKILRQEAKVRAVNKKILVEGPERKDGTAKLPFGKNQARQEKNTSTEKGLRFTCLPKERRREPREPGNWGRRKWFINGT